MLAQEGGSELFLEDYLLDGKQLPEQLGLPQKELTFEAIIFPVTSRYSVVVKKKKLPPSEISKTLIK